MKRLSLYLFLVFFTLQTPSQADDIRDFQIEGVSLGDSLLDHFSETKLVGVITNPSFKNKKYKIIKLEKLRKIELYDTLTLWVKDNDKKYIVYSVEGYIYFRNNINDCYKKQKEIIKELNDFFKDDGIKDNRLRTRKHSGDKSGKSTIKETVFWFPSGARVQISCMDFSKATGWDDSLSVAIDSKEYAYFLDNEAW